MGAEGILYYFLVFLYAFGPLIVLLWFLVKVKPKFPSGLSTAIVVFFSLLSVFTVDLILGFAMAPLKPHETVSIVYASKVSLLEETVKIVSAILGILIAKEESTWTDTRLTLAFLSGITFGLAEFSVYLANFKYTASGMLILFLSRMIHPVMTVTIMAGLLLLAKGRKLAGVAIAPIPYVTHALLDYYIHLKSYSATSLVLIVELLAFVAGVYLLIPVITEEKRTRAEFQREATVSLNDHWLNKMEGD